MKDIVELLRNAETSVVRDDGKVDLVNHVAADEIERLREALHVLANYGSPAPRQWWAEDIRRIALAALGEEKPLEDRWDNA